MKVPCTSSGGNVLGRMCRHRMRKKPVPLAMRGLDKGLLAQASARRRGRGASTRGTSATVIAKMTLSRLARVSAISAIASRTAGIDISPSMIAHDDRVGQRLKPVTRPIARPSAVLNSATLSPTDERHARAVERAAVDVAAEHVGAEPVLRRRPAQPADRRHGLRVDRAETRREAPPSRPCSSSSARRRSIVGWRRTRVANAPPRTATASGEIGGGDGHAVPTAMSVPDARIEQACS